MYALLQVDYLDSSRNPVVLQMIPRVDYNYKRGHLRSHDGNETQKTRCRLPQKLFDAQAIRYIHTCTFSIVSIAMSGKRVVLHMIMHLC